MAWTCNVLSWIEDRVERHFGVDEENQLVMESYYTSVRENHGYSYLKRLVRDANLESSVYIPQGWFIL